MIFKIKIMSEGDQVLNCWDNKVAIRRVNGEVEIFQILIEANSLPTLSNDVWLITYGDNTIDITDKDSTNKSNSKNKSRGKNSKGTKSNTSSTKNGTSLPSEDEDDADFEMSIRPKKG